MATYLTDYQLYSMAENPIKYDDLFDFNDDGALKKAISDINKLKKTYTDFFDTVINGQIGRLQQQLAELSTENEKLAASTKELSIAQKANQKTLLDNLKAAESNAQAAKNIQAAQADTVKANKSVADGVKTLTQQYNALKKQYDAAYQANDVNKLLKTRQAMKEVSVQIQALNAGLKTSTANFKGATGSYNELNEKTKSLIITLKAMPGGLAATSKEAKALQTEIYANTQKLKDFDKAINQNFRNVGNYKSALEGLKGSVTSLALSYLSITALISLVSSIVTSNAEISDSLSDVRRTASLTADEAENLVNQLKKIDTRTSLQGLLAIAVIGGQLGIAKGQLAGFTKAIDQLAVTLSGEIKGGAEEVATSLGKINGVFKIQEKEGTDVETSFNKTGSAILALGQAGLATGEFLQDFTLRVAGTANVAKIALPVILAYAATLEETGSSAEVAGSAFSKLVGNLALKRDKFFAIAKIADATLTLKSFTDLINTDANAALQKFFAGLNAGGKDLTSFTDLINEIGLKGGPAKNAVIALAQNQALLNERIGESVTAYDKGTLSAEQFAIKNDNLAASIAKLSNEFTKDTSSGGISKFFKQMVDGARNALSEIDKLFNSRSFKEVLSRLFTPDSSSFDKINSIEDLTTSSQKTSNNFLSRNPLNGAGTIPTLGSKSKKELKTDLDDIHQAYKDAYQAFLTYRNGIVKGDIVETMEPGKTLSDYKKRSDDLLYLQNKIAEAYKNTKTESKGAVEANKFEADSYKMTAKMIREKIKALQDDALSNPANKAKDIEQIKALKAQLKEVSGASEHVGAAAKDGFSILQEQLAKLEKQLQDSIIAGKIKGDDYNSPLVRKVNAARIALNKYKEDFDKVLRGKPNFPLPVALDKAPGDDPTLTNVSNKQARDQQIEDYLDGLDKQQLATKEFNIKVLNDYKNNIISKDELDTQLLNSEIANQVISYALQKNALQLELQGTKDGSKERIKILNQIADLDEKDKNDQIANAKKVEAVRVQAVKNVFDAFKLNTSIISEQLGSGFGSLFGTLTSQLEDFFSKGKEGLTTFADKFQAVADIAGAISSAVNSQIQAGLQANIDSLEKQRDYELKLAGDNAAAKDSINSKFDKKEADAKRKAAKADKENALFQIAINTAVAVVKALPNIPLSIAIGVLGAIEEVLVLARPLPKFADGTDNAPGGEAWVGEKGRELIIEDGKHRLSPATATRTHLKKGAQVKTAEETQAIFDYAKMLNGQFGNQYLDSMLRGTEIIRQAGTVDNDKVLQALNRGQLTEGQIERAMAKALGKRPTQQLVMDENGFNVYNIGRNYKIKQQRDRMRMGGNG